MNKITHPHPRPGGFGGQANPPHITRGGHASPLIRGDKPARFALRSKAGGRGVLYSIQKEIIENSIRSQIKDKTALQKIKRQVLKKTGGPFPRDLDLLKTYRSLLAQKKIKRNLTLENLLTTRPVRTLSGIAAITVLTKPYKCHGKCIYCPQEKGMPKSYLKNEPAAQRAYLTHFDPSLQVKTRLTSLALTGHNTEKIELIILGGSFAAYPKVYQRVFIQRCIEMLNEQKSHSLAQAQRRNESACHRLVGMSIEVRPDEVNLKNLKWWRTLGVTRVEIGVQSLDDDILKKCQRGHTVNAVTSATKSLKDWGFKVAYHLMPNLPGSTVQKDFAMFETLFSDPRFQPDQIKIYPLVVLKTAPLYKIWKTGHFQPYSSRTLTQLLTKIKKIVPPYVRIIRLIRDIPETSIIAGNKITNLRQILKQNNTQCHCIRCREAKTKSLGKIYFHLLKYSASFGTEYYLSSENKNQTTLYAHLRLRFPSPKSTFSDYAIIREVHTYGQVASLQTQNQSVTQHRGLGKRLIQKAENLAYENGYKKIMVIAGIGVRGYYRKLGYRLGRYGYMEKSLKIKMKN